MIITMEMRDGGTQFPFAFQKASKESWNITNVKKNGKTPCPASGLCPLCLSRCLTQQQAVIVLGSTGRVNLVSSPKKQQTDNSLIPRDQ